MEQQTTVQLEMRVIDITAGDLIKLVKDALKDATSEIILNIDSRMNNEQPPMEQALHGIEGLAEALHVSKPTAQRWKQQGYLEGGYQQIGNTIIIDNPQKLREIAAANVRRYRAAERRKGRRVKYSILEQ